MKAKKNIIYARYSTEMQRAQSIRDQERRCWEYLARTELSTQQFELIADEAVSGVMEDRPGLNRIKELIASKGLGVLICTELSRLTRTDSAVSLLQDIQFADGRFISASENIDTDKPNWEFPAGFFGVHHATANRDTATRVRGGLEGRILDRNGSAGDYCYGYRSEYEDPEAATKFTGRGPKPKKVVVIDEAAAAVVREIFQRFAIGDSVGTIVRWLNSDPSIPPIGKSNWYQQIVRSLLRREKYIGRWIYGETTIVRNGSGKKRQMPAKAHQNVLIVERPSLRIVSQDIWDKAQAHHATLKEIYGQRPDSARRGPAEHYFKLYAKMLLNGKVVCAKCGSRFVNCSTKGMRRLGCTKHAVGLCDAKTTLPVVAAEQIILSLVRDLFMNSLEWIERVADEMRRLLEEKFQTMPSEAADLASRVRNADAQINNLLDLAASDKGTQSEALMERLKNLEAEKVRLKEKLEGISRLTQDANDMPSNEWFVKQLQDFASLVGEEATAIMPILRQIISEVRAEEVILPGFKRGHMRLYFRILGVESLKVALSASKVTLAQELLNKQGQGDEFVLELPKPHRLIKLAPQIARWRAEGVKWAEICQRTGVKLTSNQVASDIPSSAAGAIS